VPSWSNTRFPRLSYQGIPHTIAKLEHSRWVRYGVAVLAVLLGLVLMLLLNLWVPMSGSPFVIFFASVMASAWYGGFGPGIFATALSTIAAKYFFIPWTQSWQIEDPVDYWRLISFILVSLLLCSLSAARRRLVKALQIERDLVAAVVSTAGNLIVVLDRQGKIVEFNQACEQATGYSFEAVQGKHPWDLFLPVEEVEAAQENFRKLRAGIFPSEYEGTWMTQTGDRRRIVWSNTVLLDNKGFVRFVISAGIDITERKQAENRLQEANEALQTLIQSSPLAIVVLDRVGRVKLWNPGAERLFGWHQDDVKGQVLPTVSSDRWPEFQENLASTLRGAVLHGQETCHQRRDGSLIEIGLWTAVLRGRSTQDDSIMTIMADLSDRKRAEAALKLSQERLTSFFEGNIIGIIFGHLDGRIEQANDAFLQMIGYDRQDVETGQLSWVAITPPEYQESDQNYIAEARVSGACTPFEKEYLHKNGSRVPVLLGFTLLGDDRQEFIAFVLDLTERKRLEHTLRRQAEELAEANRMKDEFLAVLSHELRTPLNSMLGWSRLLRLRQLDSEMTARALETIERNARLQAQLIEDILDVSKLIRGKLRLQPRLIELEPVIAAAIDAMRPAAEAKEIEIRCHLNSEPGRLLGDPDRLQQVFWNLLSNAIKFTPEGGQVEIWLSKVKGYGAAEGSSHSHVPVEYAQVQVIDSGKGISADFLPFVFDRFRQADSSITRADGGLGLGLAIVRHLVELHGGSVRADSPGLGQGATFTVRLPLLGDRQPDLAGILPDRRNPGNNHPVQGQPASVRLNATLVSDADRPNPLPLGQISSDLLTGLHILLVDDEADARDFLKAALEQYGATILVAASAAEALNLLMPASEHTSPEFWKPDVLVSDIAMPHEDGYSFIRKLRHWETMQGTFTPALALTAYARREDYDRALQEGFQMYLSKPIEPTALVTAILELAGRAGGVRREE
jgi:PAS domain S-box-containing protein